MKVKIKAHKILEYMELKLQIETYLDGFSDAFLGILLGSTDDNVVRIIIIKHIKESIIMNHRV